MSTTVSGLTFGVVPAINWKVQEFNGANYFNMLSIVCTASIFSTDSNQISDSSFLQLLHSCTNFQGLPDSNTAIQVLVEKVTQFVAVTKVFNPQGQSARFTISLLMSGYDRKTGSREHLVEQINHFSGVFNFSEERPESIYRGA